MHTILSLILTAAVATTPVPYLVRDLETGPGAPGGSSRTSYETPVIDGIAYFGACSQGTCGLWRSDGTEAGTYAVKTITVLEIASVGKRLFFTGFDFDHGRELWVSDGTTAGTHLLGHPLPLALFGTGSWPRDLTAVGDQLLFSAADDLHGRELWRSDGNTTERVADIAPGPGSSIDLSDFPSLTALGNRVFGFLRREAEGQEPWISDGTAAGTFLLRDIHAGPSSSRCANSILAAGDLVWFGADDGVSGCEPWVTDGTRDGTRRLRDLEPGAPGSMPADFFAADGRVFFGTSGPTTRFDLWVSDGSEDGTTIFESMPRDYQWGLVIPHGFLDGSLLFSVRTPPPNYFDGFLLRSRGDGVEEVHRFTSVRQMSEADGTLYFLASTIPCQSCPTPPFESLWRSDGTDAGTAPVAADEHFAGSTWLTLFSGGLLPSPHVEIPAGSSRPHDFLAAGDRVVFGTRGSGAARGVWSTDGTEAGTTKLASLPAFVDGDPTPVASLGSIVFFSAAGALWRTDATTTGTYPLADESSIPRRYVGANGLLFFTASGAKPWELWVTDGSTMGTRRIATLFDYADYLTEVGGLVYFVSQNELWRSDGTEAGTLALHRFPEPRFGFRLGSLAGRLLLSRCSDVPELWTSDGTPDGTEMLRLGDNACAFTPFVPFQGEAYFGTRASDGTTLLWATDGTDAGTRQVADLHQHTPGDMIAVRDSLYLLTSSDFAPERLLWRTDGSASGTQVVFEISDRTPGSIAGRLFAHQDRVFFPFQEENNFGVRQSLWSSDGTAAGSGAMALLRMSFAGVGFDATAVGSRYHYSGFDGATGWEPWAVDLDPSFPCPGDCDDDDLVSDGEIVEDVAHALEGTAPSCSPVPIGPIVRIDRLVAAVRTRLSPASCRDAAVHREGHGSQVR